MRYLWTEDTYAGLQFWDVACVMKSLVGEFTQSGKWSVKGALMGECWKKLCVGIYG